MISSRQYVPIALIVIIAMCLCMLVFMYSSYVQYKTNIAIVESKQAAIEAYETKLSNISIMETERQAIAQLRTELRNVGKLSLPEVGLESLLLIFEGSKTSGITYQTIDFRSKEKRCLLELYAHLDADFSKLVDALEKETVVVQVVIQKREREGSKTLYSLELKLR